LIYQFCQLRLDQSLMLIYRIGFELQKNTVRSSLLPKDATTCPMRVGVELDRAIVIIDHMVVIKTALYHFLSAMSPSMLPTAVAKIFKVG